MNSISRRKQKNIGSVLAIALGVTLLIGSYVGAEGVLNVYTADRLNFSGTADITVNDRVNIYMNDTIVDYIANSDDSRLDDVEVVSGRIRMSLSYYSSGQIESSILTNAIDPSVKGYGSFYDTNNNVIDEASLLIGNAIMVSDSMAELLNINIDDYVETSMPDALGGTIPLRFRVVGIFDDEKGRGMEGVYINSPVAYVSLNYVQSQQLPEYQHSITTVVIKFLDSKVDRSIENFNVDDKVFPGMEIINAGINATRDIVKQHYPYAYVSSEIVSAVEEVARDLEGISSVLNLFSYILNAVALLLIVNVQSMSLEDRRYQTAVLRAMGS
ncbi:MAG: ABC transporter permease, partial [Candidatus Heimdallarchaeota archaeon]|nr:ABC transporter permease [Candidatus Heimdallarchaeota archaeon]